jgi:hypothetical protein
MKLRRHRRSQIAALCIAALLTSCSTLPTAPIHSELAGKGSVQSGRAEDVGASPDGEPQSGGSVREPMPTPAAPAAILEPDPHPAPTPDPDNGVEATETVNGSQGGRISAARVSVRVPQGAFLGGAEITIEVPDPDELHCKLHIVPESKNNFSVPVELTFNASNYDGDVRELGVWWFNEESQEWEAVDSFVDAVKGEVRALLPHFSEYKVESQLRSKAGW